MAVTPNHPFKPSIWGTFIYGNHQIQVCMHVCMYVCMYACMHVCMYACMHACMHACMYACMYVCMYACMHACMHACMYVCMYVFIYICIHTCICIYIYMDTYIYIYGYIYIYIYVCINLLCIVMYAVIWLTNNEWTCNGNIMEVSRDLFCDAWWCSQSAFNIRARLQQGGNIGNHGLHESWVDEHDGAVLPTGIQW